MKMYQKGKKRCVACNGSGWYDNCDKNGNPIPCGACNGTGYEIVGNIKKKINKTIKIEFTEEEIFEILDDYYGDVDEEDFALETWTEEEIKNAIVNR